jgi:hypothetical protein
MARTLKVEFGSINDDNVEQVSCVCLIPFCSCQGLILPPD